MTCSVRRTPSRSTTSLTGSVAAQPCALLAGAAVAADRVAHRLERFSPGLGGDARREAGHAVDGDDPVAGRQHAGCAGLPFSTRSTTGATSGIGRDANSTQRMRNASTMLTAGPAAMTTIRFQTFWR